MMYGCLVVWINCWMVVQAFRCGVVLLLAVIVTDVNVLMPSLVIICRHRLSFIVCPRHCVVSSSIVIVDCELFSVLILNDKLLLHNTYSVLHALRCPSKTGGM